VDCLYVGRNYARHTVHRTRRYHVGIIGYCSGGRQVYLAACTLPGIDAAVDCYGGGVVARPEELNSRQPVAPIDYTKDLSCPLLGLFGREDHRPSPEDVAKTEAELKNWGKSYEFHMYENAGHSFFSVDRPSYRVEAAMDGWKKVFIQMVRKVSAVIIISSRASLGEEP
jgi:carboxymethylenebutenolidase